MSQAMNLADLRRPSPRNPNTLQSTAPAEYRPQQPIQQPIQQPQQAESSDLVKLSFETAKGFDMLQRLGSMFADSSLIPDTYRGKPANCIIACELAFRLGTNPLTLMQHMYLVHNKPALSSVFLIATFNKCGRYSSIKYEFAGQPHTDQWGCRAICRELATNEIITGPWVTIDMAKRDGWYGKAGSKWQTMPELMLRYRAAAFLIRTTAPEISLGLQTTEEVHDVYDAVQPRRTTAYVEKEDLPSASDQANVEQDEAADSEIQSTSPQEPKKRHRRTKAEMEAARAAQKMAENAEISQEDPFSKATPTVVSEAQSSTESGVSVSPSALSDEVMSPDADTPPWEQNTRPTPVTNIPLTAQVDEICEEHGLNRHMFDYVADAYAKSTGKPIEDGQRYFLEHPEQVQPRYQQLKAQGNVETPQEMADRIRRNQADIRYRAEIDAARADEPEN